MGKSHVTLAGKIFPNFSQCAPTSDKVSTAVAALTDTVDVGDVLLLAILGWASVPLTKLIYKIFYASKHVESKRFDETYIYLASECFSQVMRVALLILAADYLDVLLEAFDVEIAQRLDFGHIIARVSFTVWVAFKLVTLEKYLIAQAVSRKPDKLEKGKASVLDRLIELVVWFVAALFLIDVFDVEMGAGLTSMFALGGVGTLVVSLASKDLAEQFISGLFLQISDKFYEGDLVRLGDGTGGVVFKIGWMHTLIRASDDTRLRIPNSQLAALRVTNLSRVDQCQVRQVLYFKYSDMQRMPALAEDIKQAIKDACPDLVTDGSRPFRCHWFDITTDRLEMVCDCHFNLKPFGDVYLDNRQHVLEAIGSAITKNGMELAVPTYNFPKAKDN